MRSFLCRILDVRVCVAICGVRIELVEVGDCAETERRIFGG